MTADRVVLFFTAPLIVAAHVARGAVEGVRQVVQAWGSFSVPAFEYVEEDYCCQKCKRDSFFECVCDA
jgi:hypothetical protein